jgi:MoaA/NifB/PqqE/SkfB family radical SAM enzyme
MKIVKNVNIPLLYKLIIMRFISDKYRKPVLDYIYIPITFECNRNCKGCVCYSPLAGPETRITVNQFERSIKRLIEISGIETIQTVDISGGEPLCHPEILDFLKCSRDIFSDANNTSIFIRTNGILLPDFIEKNHDFITQNKISIEYSQYPEIDISNILFLSNKYKIKTYQHFKGLMINFIRTAVSVKPNYRDMNEEWEKCSDKNCCHTLRIIGDKAYYTGCSMPVYLDTLDKYFNTNFESLLKKGDRVDIFDPNTTLDDLLNFHQPIHFCAHCRRRTGVTFETELSTKSKDEWIFS